MAKPEIEILVEVLDNPIQPIRVWISCAKLHLTDVASVEGISHIFLEGETEISVMIDKRYKASEVADELRELLGAEVPDIFRE